MFRILCLLIGLALGHIQTSYILGRVFKKIDIRKYGSGSAGMTNSLRVMGAKFAVPTLLFDIVKSLGAFVICSAIFGGSFSFASFGDAGVVPGMYGSLGAVLGHIFPVYMRFRGGKGIACVIGMVLALNWRIACIMLGISVIIILIKRYISLASVIGLILLPVAVACFNYNIETVGITYFVTVLLTYKHMENIIRLYKGTENKLGQKVRRE